MINQGIEISSSEATERPGGPLCELELSQPSLRIVSGKEIDALWREHIKQRVSAEELKPLVGKNYKGNISNLARAKGELELGSDPDWFVCLRADPVGYLTAYFDDRGKNTPRKLTQLKSTVGQFLVWAEGENLFRTELDSIQELMFRVAPFSLKNFSLPIIEDWIAEDCGGGEVTFRYRLRAYFKFVAEEVRGEKLEGYTKNARVLRERELAGEERIRKRAEQWKNVPLRQDRLRSCSPIETVIEEICTNPDCAKRYRSDLEKKYPKNINRKNIDKYKADLSAVRVFLDWAFIKGYSAFSGDGFGDRKGGTGRRKSSGAMLVESVKKREDVPKPAGEHKKASSSKRKTSRAQERRSDVEIEASCVQENSSDEQKEESGRQEKDLSVKPETPDGEIKVSGAQTKKSREKKEGSGAKARTSGNRRRAPREILKAANGPTKRPFRKVYPNANRFLLTRDAVISAIVKEQHTPINEGVLHVVKDLDKTVEAEVLGQLEKGELRLDEGIEFLSKILGGATTKAEFMIEERCWLGLEALSDLKQGEVTIRSDKVIITRSGRPTIVLLHRDAVEAIHVFWNIFDSAVTMDRDLNIGSDRPFFPSFNGGPLIVPATFSGSPAEVNFTMRVWKLRNRIVDHLLRLGELNLSQICTMSDEGFRNISLSSSWETKRDEYFQCLRVSLLGGGAHAGGDKYAFPAADLGPLTNDE